MLSVDDQLVARVADAAVGLALLLLWYSLPID